MHNYWGLLRTADQTCYTRTRSTRSLVKAAPMLVVLFLTECCGICAAISIVAWSGDPSDVLDGRASLIRFVGPLFAVALCLLTLRVFYRWLMGDQIEPGISWGWILGAGVLLVAASAMARNALRRPRTNQPRQSPRHGRSTSSVAPSLRPRQRLSRRRKRPE
jgi:hypothetical protein